MLVRHVIGPMQFLLNVGMHIACLRQLNALCIIGQLGCQGHHLRCKGGREHQGLITLLATLINSLEVICKTHV